MNDNILFCGEIAYNGEMVEIKATTDDATSIIIKKALDLVLAGKIEVYLQTPPESYPDLPETYIQAIYNGTDYIYASEEIVGSEDLYDIYIITKNEQEMEGLCKKVCQSLHQYGFCINDSGTPVDSTDGEGYTGIVLSVSYLR